MEKLTKAQLIDRLKAAEAIIEKTKLLSSVVDEKNKELSLKDSKIKQLQAQYSEDIAELQKGYEFKLNEIKSGFDDKLKNTLDKELSRLKKEHSSWNEVVTHDKEKLVEIVNKREAELNKLISIYTNLLKTLQGTLDNAIELNEYFNQEVRK